MTEDTDTPPQPPKPGFWLFVGAYILGMLVGMFVTFFGLFTLGFALSGGSAADFLALLCFAVLIGAIVVRVVLHVRHARREPFVLGVLTGTCIAALAMGLCFAAISGLGNMH
jgi:hypothetical protein